MPSIKKNILNDILDQKVFYYLHSFQVIPVNKNNILAYYDRKNEKINSAIASNNIWGVQFHPEKSGDAGLEFLKSFSSLEIQ